MVDIKLINELTFSAFKNCKPVVTDLLAISNSFSLFYSSNKSLKLEQLVKMFTSTTETKTTIGAR